MVSKSSATNEHQLEPLTFELIDRKIEEHRAAIIQLQRSRNSLVPIATLPPEILGRIFIFHVLCNGSASVKDTGFYYPAAVGPQVDMSRSWINVSYVSHHWRETALNNPEMWSYWGKSNPGFCEVLVQRSKSAPVHVRLALAYQKQMAMLSQMFGLRAVRERVKELHLSGYASTLDGALDYFDASSSDAPEADSLSLQSLRISVVSHSSGVSTLPNAFTSRELPHLTRLELSGCKFDWDLPIFSYPGALSTLALSRNTVPPSLSQLLSILRNHPRLSELRLELSALRNSSVKTVLAIVDLPLIRSIRLLGPVEACVGLMRYVSYIKSSTGIEVIIKGGSKHSGQLDSLVQELFSNHFAQGTVIDTVSNSLCHASVTSDGVEQQIDCWDTMQSSEQPSTVAPPCPGQIRVAWPRRVSASLTIKLLHEVLPLSNLRRLSVIDLWFSPAVWVTKIFRRLSDLEWLEVSGQDAVHNVVTALMPFTPELQRKLADGARAELGTPSYGSGSKSRNALGSYEERINGNPQLSVALPRLCRLEIQEAKFVPVLYEDLKECLLARRMANHGLRHLKLSQCLHLSSEGVENYQAVRLAEEVVWDELEDFENFDEEAEELLV